MKADIYPAWHQVYNPDMTGQNSKVSCIGALLLTLGLAISAAASGQDAELISMWDASDERSTASIDHSAWQDILDAYLISDHPSGINRFDYGALKANSEDRQKLGGYLQSLSDIDPREHSRDEQMAYWINLYNALTVYVVVPRFPVDSIKDIKSGLIDFGPWNLELFPLQGEKLTLNQIEHGILRPIWQDPRIHYAVNCASHGCPNLAGRAYQAETLEQMLEASAREYVNHPRGAQIVDDELIVSSIYDWYKVDFGNTSEGVIAHLSKYAEPELKAQLAKFDDFDDDYDWRLNAPE